jgi:hypothetical protein
MPLYSLTPTPWATICNSCGKVYLSLEFYTRQMQAAWSTWRCPCCGQEAEFDNENFENFLEVEVEK